MPGHSANRPTDDACVNLQLSAHGCAAGIHGLGKQESYHYLVQAGLMQACVVGCECSIPFKQQRQSSVRGLHVRDGH